jgi:hypothetical protein
MFCIERALTSFLVRMVAATILKFVIRNTLRQRGGVALSIHILVSVELYGVLVFTYASSPYAESVSEASYNEHVSNGSAVVYECLQLGRLGVGVH